MKTKTITVIATAAVLSLSALTAPIASGSSAQITRAQANPSWTSGSFEASVVFDGCPPDQPCSWAVYATVTPPKFECGSIGQFNEYVKTIQLSGFQSANGAVSIERSGEPIVRSIVGQQLCIWGVLRPELLDQPCTRGSVCSEESRLSVKSFSGRNPCKGRKSKEVLRRLNLFPPTGLLTPKQYRAKFCPNRG